MKVGLEMRTPNVRALGSRTLKKVGLGMGTLIEFWNIFKSQQKSV